MDCEEARPSLEAYVDRELEPANRLEIEEHLAECPLCRDAVERITKSNLTVRMNMPVYKAPPELELRVRATLRKEDKPNFKWLTERKRQLAYVAALVVAGFVLASAWLTLSSNEVTPWLPRPSRTISDRCWLLIRSIAHPVISIK